jgi:hypothetical protein
VLVVLLALTTLVTGFRMARHLSKPGDAP